LPAGGIKAFQSEGVWYGQPRHDRRLEPSLASYRDTDWHDPQGI